MIFEKAVVTFKSFPIKVSQMTQMYCFAEVLRKSFLSGALCGFAVWYFLVHFVGPRFDNMRAPAALLAGAVVPIGFLGAPKITESDPAWMARLSDLARKFAPTSAES